MLGVEDYGSDSDSDKPTPSTAQVKPKRMKKIQIALPSLPTRSPSPGAPDGAPPAKKPRLGGGGAGMSGLLAMLPQPKQKGPIVPERVLGGGSGPGLVFTSGQTSAAAHDESSSELKTATSMDFMPTSIKKGRANVSLEEGKTTSRPSLRTAVPAQPAVDFFSLGSTSTLAPIPSTSKQISAAPPEPTRPGLMTLSAAPEVHTYVPPPPTPEDPYPGYYELPQGGYAAYDTEYYRAYHEKWTKDYNDHVRALERGGGRGFEGYEQGDVEEIDMTGERERAMKEMKEREAKKALTAPGGRKGDEDDEDAEKDGPKMNIKGAKLGRVAKTRHQLTTLLSDAYSNREMLEEKIAQGKRNRKEAGNKYGF